MPINKPYFRIIRPIASGYDFNNPCAGYHNDKRFVSERERNSLIHSGILIVKDFLELFDYIEPCDDHRVVYSHRIYELFLRTSTEFEANCKGVLIANNCKPQNRDYSILDYYKLNKAMRLSEYKIEFSRWIEQYYYLPFADWNSGTSLSWYKAYNSVKHDRFNNYKQANLFNLLLAICGLLSILHAQFGIRIEFEYKNLGKIGAITPNRINFGPFFITPPKFPEEEKYLFNWSELSVEENPYQSFPF